MKKPLLHFSDDLFTTDHGHLAAWAPIAMYRRCEAVSPYHSKLGARCSKDGLDQDDPATMKKPFLHFLPLMTDDH
jgi:hypothetical protein